MKIAINKTKFNTVLLSFFIVIGFCLIYFLVRGFPLNWNMYSIDKHSDLAEICLLEEDNDIVIKCNAFLKTIEYLNNEEICLSLSLVINDNSGIKDIKICDSTKLVHINDPELDSEMLVPVEIKLKYKYKIPFTYKLESITPEILDDEVTLDILQKLSDNEVSLFNVRTNEIADIEEKGYYTQESDSIVKENTIGIITFTESTVKNIHSSNGRIFLTMGITVNGVNREIQIDIEEFTYSYFHNMDGNDLRSIHITSENISEIPLNKSLSTTFAYIPYDKKINIDKVKEYCSGGLVQWKGLLCNNLDSLEELQLDKGIDEYVKESLDKLILERMMSNG